MDLPENIPMSPVSFMDGAKGWACQVYANEKWGVTLSKERAKHSEPFISSLTFTHIPDKVFKSYAELREAAKAIK